MKKTYKDRMIMREWIADALILLMQKEPFDKIKITDIAIKSGVSRATFYRLYNSKEEVLEQYCRYLTQLYSYKIRNNCDDYLKVLFETLKAKKEFLLTLIRCHKDYLIYNTVHQNLKQMSISQDNDYICLQYISGGITYLVISWIKDGCRMPIGDLCVTIYGLIGRNMDKEMNHIANVYKETFSNL